METYSLSTVVFFFGLCFGSIINFLIIRLPSHQSLLKPLLCSHCKEKLFWYHSMSLFLYLFLKSRCEYCYKTSLAQNIIVELLCAFLTLGLFYKLGLSVDFFIITILFYLLVLLSFIDLKYHAVPDYLLLIILILVFFIPSYDVIQQFKSAFLLSGAMVLLVFILNFYIQNIKSRLTHNEALKTQTALGEGDIPIIAVMGALLGIQGALMAIFLASLFAIIPALYNKIVKTQQETPFIPFLSLGLGVEYIFSLSKGFN